MENGETFRFSNIISGIHERIQIKTFVSDIGTIANWEKQLGWWLFPYVYSSTGSILTFLTYPFTALTSLFYSIPSINQIIDSSAVQSVIVPIRQTTESVVESLKFSGTPPRYGWKEEVIGKPAETVWKIDAEKEKELNMIVALLAERVDKVEGDNTKHSDKFSNVQQVIATMMKSNEDLRKYYDDKLAAVENELKEKEALLLSSNNEEISAIKIELQSLREQQLQLKSCCDKTITVPTVEIEKHVHSILAGYFDDGNNDEKNELSKVDVAKMIKNLFIAKHDLEARIANISATVQVNAQDVKDLTNKVMSDVTNHISMISMTSNNGSEGRPVGGLTEENVRNIVMKALKMYDADKTGRVDYALESAGGQIISTRCTQQYNMNTRAYKLLGFTLFYESNNPRTVIQGNPVQPGACWVFQDFPGYLLIRLRSLVMVTGFTMEHAPRSILPNSEMRSAPRKFDVWGLKDENDKEPVLFGDYEFVDSDASLQYFPVQNTTITTPYEYVELRIHSNHGQLEYSCLYRFRIHGTPV